MKKNMLRIIATTLIVFNVFSVVAIASSPGDNSIGDALVAKAENNSMTRAIDDSMIYDLNPVEEKSTVQESTSIFSVFAEPATCTSSTSFGFMSYNSTATSKATKMLDYIYAKSRSFSSSGALVASDSQSEYNTSYVGATAKCPDDSWAPSYAYGNHTYMHTGFKDIVHETYKKR